MGKSRLRFETVNPLQKKESTFCAPAECSTRKPKTYSLFERTFNEKKSGQCKRAKIVTQLAARMGLIGTR